MDARFNGRQSREPRPSIREAYISQMAFDADKRNTKANVTESGRVSGVLLYLAHYPNPKNKAAVAQW